ncbi:MAG: alpha/beta fold hydrolase [Rhodoglobus sp.]
MVGDPANAPGWFREFAIKPSTPRSLDVEGVEIAYEVWPAGTASAPTPLMFVHGGSAAGCWWHPLVALLGGSRSLTALDLSGHGRSGWRERYTFSQWMREVTAVAEVAFPEGCILVGHSLGGALVSAALAAGHRSPAVVLLDSDARPRNPPRSPSTIRSPRLFADAAEAANSLVVHKTPWPAWLASYIAERSVVPEGDSWRLRRDPRVAAVAIDTIELQKLAPTVVHLVAAGESRFRFHVNPPPEWQNEGSTVRVTVMDGLGHDLMMESPERVAQLLTRILPS